MGLAYPVSYDLPKRSELEIHSTVQGDQYLTENCVGSCASKDGIRIADLGLTVRHFGSPKSQIFLGFRFDFRSEQQFSGMGDLNNLQFNPDLDEIDERVVGFAIQDSKFSFGKHKLDSEKFGPSVYNFLNFSMSGLNDDRIDLYSSELGRTIKASSAYRFQKGVGAMGSLAVDYEDSNSSKVTVDYDLVLEITFPQLEGGVVSIAAKSLSGSSPEFEMQNYGVKMSLFSSKQVELVLGYSENDFGEYFELSAAKAIGEKKKIGLGFSLFNAEKVKPEIPNRFDILNSEFYYVNFAYAFTRYLHGILEYDTIDYGDRTERVSLIGLKLSF